MVSTLEESQPEEKKRRQPRKKKEVIKSWKGKKFLLKGGNFAIQKKNQGRVRQGGREKGGIQHEKDAERDHFSVREGKETMSRLPPKGDTLLDKEGEGRPRTGQGKGKREGKKRISRLNSRGKRKKTLLVNTKERRIKRGGQTTNQ